jgi:MFS family permease
MATAAEAIPGVSSRRWTLLGVDASIFLVCLVAWTLTNMDQALFGYALPGILAEFKLPLEAAGIVLTISFGAAAVLVIGAGVAADRFGRAVTLVVLLVASAVMVGLQGFAGGIVVLALFRALGFGLSGGLSPITNVLVVENAAPRARGVAMGLLQCGYPLGWLLASLFAAPLLQHYGWRAACFLAFAVVPLGGLIWLVLRRRGLGGPRVVADTSAGPKPGVRSLFEPRYRRATLATMAVFFMFGGAYAGSALFFPIFFTQDRGYTPAEAASLVGLSNGVAVFGYVGAALVGEYLLTRRNVFVLWCLGGAGALLGLLWLSAGHAQDMVWYAVMAGLFFGSQAVLPVLIAEVFPADVRATAMAVCASAPLSAGFAVFPLIVPVVVTALGWKAGLTLVAAPLLVGAALAALVLPNRRSGLALEGVA